MDKGLFITVEGPNGVGKSTFVDELRNLFPAHDVITTKEPSQTSFGKFVQANEQCLSGYPYAQLIWSDRYYHVHECVIPHLQNGKRVICDRFVESSFVLQGFDGVPYEQIWDLNRNIIIPDISVVLFASSESIGQRLSRRATLSRFEERMTREQEIAGYKKTINYLEAKGYNFLVLENNDKSDLERNVEIVRKTLKAILR